MLNSLLIKPTGPDCNLRCNYCFYRQKAGIYPGSKVHRMKEPVLDRLIREGMQSGAVNPCFSWQGGEPALMGLGFFKRVVELQIHYGTPGQSVANSLQTNATLLDARWAEFLAEYNFLVGVSMDGPPDLHDHYRKDDKRAGTHQRVLNSIRTLERAGVEFNVLVLLNDRNVKEPRRIFEYLLDNGIRFMQFVPCVEPGPGGQPAPFSITPQDYGDFLCEVFDLWTALFPHVSVRDFDDLLMKHLGETFGTCIYGPSCENYVVVEHNGDIYPCDFFVQPRWKLGNLLENSLADIAESEKYKQFAAGKMELSEQCQCCEWLSMCHGGCQKHRTVLGDPMASPTYFCPAYRQLFAHANETLAEMARRIKNG